MGMAGEQFTNQILFSLGLPERWCFGFGFVLLSGFFCMLPVLYKQFALIFSIIYIGSTTARSSGIGCPFAAWLTETFDVRS